MTRETAMIHLRLRNTAKICSRDVMVQISHEMTRLQTFTRVVTWIRNKIEEIATRENLSHAGSEAATPGSSTTVLSRTHLTCQQGFLRANKALRRPAYAGCANPSRKPYALYGVP